jgi:hypothetical protein
MTSADQLVIEAGNGHTVSLPPSSDAGLQDDQPFCVKYLNGSGSATVSGNGANIDGLATVTMLPYQEVCVQYHLGGHDWRRAPGYVPPLAFLLSLGNNNVTAGYTMSSSDHGIVVFQGSSNSTTTLPPSTDPYLRDGDIYIWKYNVGSGTGTLAANTGQNIDGASTVSVGAYGVLWLRWHAGGTNWNVVNNVPNTAITLQTNGTNNLSQSTFNLKNSTTNAAGLSITYTNASGGDVKPEIAVSNSATALSAIGAAASNAATTVDNQTCTLGSTCTVTQILARAFCTGTATASSTLYPYGMGGSSASTCTVTSTSKANVVVLPQNYTITSIRGFATAGGVNSSSGAVSIAVYNSSGALQTTLSAACTFGTAQSCSGSPSYTGSAGDFLIATITTQASETLANVTISVSGYLR